ncbi:hypothetical protein PM082_017095 [Marasmius tenuissimus]|nr:hypothetical protein PM082_017095 [Marasmius tenuissimus]
MAEDTILQEPLALSNCMGMSEDEWQPVAASKFGGSIEPRRGLQRYEMSTESIVAFLSKSMASTPQFVHCHCNDGICRPPWARNGGMAAEYTCRGAGDVLQSFGERDHILKLRKAFAPARGWLAGLRGSEGLEKKECSRLRASTGNDRLSVDAELKKSRGRRVLTSTRPSDFPFYHMDHLKLQKWPQYAKNNPQDDRSRFEDSKMGHDRECAPERKQNPNISHIAPPEGLNDSKKVN